MSQGTQHHPEPKESFFDKMLGHHHHQEEEEQHDHHAPEKQHPNHKGHLREEIEKEEGKFKQFIKKDEELDEEGQTYGGLM